MSQAGMRTRLRQLRALLSLTDNEFYEYLSELSEVCPFVNIHVHVLLCVMVSAQV